MNTDYVLEMVDKDENGTINSGDWMNSTATNFTLDNKAQLNTTVNINFIIP